MKKNNPMYKQFLDQYEHQWFECLAVFASSIESLKDKKEDENKEHGHIFFPQLLYNIK